MQRLVSQQMKKLKKDLKSCLKKEKLLVDIFLIGSALKGKKKPNDVDVISLFREKDYAKIEDINYNIKKIGDSFGLKMHVEPLIIDNMFSQSVYSTVLHEGFSIKNMKSVSEIIGLKSYLLISYNLKNKKASDKVRFSYALYGRHKGEGLLKDLKGKEISKGSIFIPIGEEEVIKGFFEQWQVNYKIKRISVNL